MSIGFAARYMNGVVWWTAGRRESGEGAMGYTGRIWDVRELCCSLGVDEESYLYVVDAGRHSSR